MLSSQRAHCPPTGLLGRLAQEACPDEQVQPACLGPGLGDWSVVFTPLAPCGRLWPGLLLGRSSGMSVGGGDPLPLEAARLLELVQMPSEPEHLINEQSPGQGLQALGWEEAGPLWGACASLVPALWPGRLRQRRREDPGLMPPLPWDGASCSPSLSPARLPCLPCRLLLGVGGVEFPQCPAPHRSKPGGL